jgi:hypothetical protein
VTTHLQRLSVRQAQLLSVANQPILKIPDGL